MEDLEVLVLDFSYVATTKKYVYPFASAVVVSVIDSEIRKYFLVVTLQPQLRVSKNKEELVISNRSFLEIDRLEVFAVGKGKDESVLF